MPDDPNTTDLHEAVAEALLKAEWSGGYDRNGSHDADAYREFVEGLGHSFNEGMAAVFAEQLAKVAIATVAAYAIKRFPDVF